MIDELKKRKDGTIVSRSFSPSDEPFESTVNNLAVTPSDMHRMVERGIPVSPSNDAMFFDGTPNVTFELPLEDARGVDVNDIWNAQQDARRKIKNANSVDVQNYG
nr:MAG: hypothetical protein [Microvirus sp.]